MGGTGCNHSIPALRNKLGNPCGTAFCLPPSPGRGTHGGASRALRGVCVAAVCARGHASDRCGLRGVRGRLPPSPPPPEKRLWGRFLSGFQSPRASLLHCASRSRPSFRRDGVCARHCRRADPALHENRHGAGRDRGYFSSLHGLLGVGMGVARPRGSSATCCPDAAAPGSASSSSWCTRRATPPPALRAQRARGNHYLRCIREARKPPRPLPAGAASGAHITSPPARNPWATSPRSRPQSSNSDDHPSAGRLPSTNSSL